MSDYNTKQGNLGSQYNRDRRKMGKKMDGTDFLKETAFHSDFEFLSMVPEHVEGVMESKYIAYIL